MCEIAECYFDCVQVAAPYGQANVKLNEVFFWEHAVNSTSCWYLLLVFVALHDYESL